MARGFILFLIALIISTSIPQSSKAQTANEMLSACKEINEAKLMSGGQVLMPTDFETGMCWGAFGAVQHFFNFRFVGEENPALNNCLPEDSTRLQLIKIFYKFGLEHPERLHEKWGFVAFSALYENFKCD